jgi:hypothetical protein
MFVESVSHSFDYEGGFTTSAVFSSPTAIDGGGITAMGTFKL